MNEITIPLSLNTDCIALKLNRIPPGQFVMGSSQDRGLDDWSDTPMGEFNVIITQEFWLGVHLVTQCQWQTVMGTNPSRFKGSNLPIEMVSWQDAMDFCHLLNINELYKLEAPERYVFRLPTEAEWEYACKSNSIQKYQLGNTLDDLSKVAWHRANIEAPSTQVVGQKEANHWGLYDMLGNVMEWCLDCPTDYPSGTTQIDWVGELEGQFRNLRGGSAFNPPDIEDKLTCSGRAYAGLDPNWFFGFRLCLGREIKSKK